MRPIAAPLAPPAFAGEHIIELFAERAELAFGIENDVLHFPV
ncbi:MAG TPA: hypothetical protein VGI45_24150 [Terracidiphilus sp.]